MEEFKIFIVEDDEWYRELLNYNLNLNPDFLVKKFSSAENFLAHLHEKPDVVTLDYALPDMAGTEVLKKIKDFDPDIEVIVISEQDRIETAVELLKLGAYDYIIKTRDVRERLLNIIDHIRKSRNLQTRISSLQKEVETKYNFEKAIIGKSDEIKKVFSLIDKAINTNITVTITGETGTGKELVAKAVHFNSKRRDYPFIAVNLAAIPKDLLESELFGHEKGAFTGANIRRIGKFEEANKGTLFLDEIGEMDITLQAKLLRVLQEKEITRIGSNKTIKTDCRIVVATNRNLLEEVKNGNFRKDLFYRLFGLQIELPPLRSRVSDILLLAKHFLKKFSRENELDDFYFSSDAQKRLMNYPYPGNVRELKSVVELAAVMANSAEIKADDIAFSTDEAFPDLLAEEMTLKEFNDRIIRAYLKRYSNNVKLVAEKLDISLSTIYRFLKEGKDSLDSGK